MQRHTSPSALSHRVAFTLKAREIENSKEISGGKVVINRSPLEYEIALFGWSIHGLQKRTSLYGILRMINHIRYDSPDMDFGLAASNQNLRELPTSYSLDSLAFYILINSFETLFSRGTGQAFNPHRSPRPHHLNYGAYVTDSRVAAASKLVADLEQKKLTKQFTCRLCAAAVSLLLGRIGRWSGREITRSALSLARSAQAERDKESRFFVRAIYKTLLRQTIKFWYCTKEDNRNLQILIDRRECWSLSDKLKNETYLNANPKKKDCPIGADASEPTRFAEGLAKSKRGWGSFEDEARKGRPPTAVTQSFNKNWMPDQQRCKPLFTITFSLRKLCSKRVPLKLADQQKDHRIVSVLYYDREIRRKQRRT
ncbi:hypothetical protein EVAR_61412_1 [Eumeta japonica]|uniref:Uncharacterized protein n=1 Tax=Eumeta variegata TaxID=151549 RepID=A0A4C1YTL7_EUMVA|nr:hypothetical protein EVAR_61412_1 [Eumeta japonica]